MEKYMMNKMKLYWILLKRTDSVGIAKRLELFTIAKIATSVSAMNARTHI